MQGTRWCRTIRLAATGIGLTLLFASAIGPQPGAREPQSPAVVVDVAGDVRSQPAGEIEWATVTTGAELQEGTKLSSGEGASAVVEFGPGHRAQLGEKTVVLLSQLQYGGRSDVENTTIHLAVGRILNSVKKLRTEDSEYAVRTPTTVAAVRGTFYEVTYDPETQQTSVKVLDGLVEMQSRLGRRMKTMLREREKSGVGGEGEVAPTGSLSDQETQDLNSASQGILEAGEPTKGADEAGQMDVLQTNILERMDEIENRLSDENRARQFDRLQNEDDDD